MELSAEQRKCAHKVHEKFMKNYLIISEIEEFSSSLITLLNLLREGATWLLCTNILSFYVAPFPGNC